jgi:hypothetical protein
LDTKLILDIIWWIAWLAAWVSIYPLVIKEMAKNSFNSDTSYDIIEENKGDNDALALVSMDSSWNGIRPCRISWLCLIP